VKKLLLVAIVTVAVLASSLVPFTASTSSAAGPVVWDQAFADVWNTTDYPVDSGAVSRSWYWGPSFDGRDYVYEPYLESPGGERLVQYFDKSRMEINNPYGDPWNMWYVTNGLLVTEMVEGSIQLGDSAFAGTLPCDEPVAGDPGDPYAVTYATLNAVLGAAPNMVGLPAAAYLDWDGTVSLQPDLAAAFPETQLVVYDNTFGHNIPAVFWDYMHQGGMIYVGQDTELAYVDTLIDWVFAMGYPITDPHWVNVRVNGVDTLVLVQAFQRRVLTYTPSNPAGWQVEMGNVGQHYYKWRYLSGNVAM
jgi:polysaccharide biosynthesis protein PslG